MLNRLIPTLAIAAAVSFATGAASARDISIEPVSWSYLMVACANAGGHFSVVGSHYTCIVENCDGQGGQCVIDCDDGGGLETCTGQVPHRLPATWDTRRDLLMPLGLMRLRPSADSALFTQPDTDHRPTSDAAPILY